jgi:hypothetical protein
MVKGSKFGWVKRMIFVMGSAAQHLIFKLEAIRICRRMGFRRRSIFNVTPWILSFTVTFWEEDSLIKY